LGCHYASFPTRSLGFVELFPNLRGPASRLAITRTIWSEQTRARWPPLSQLSFECLWPPLLRSNLPSDCFVWSEWTNQNSLPWHAVIYPLNF
jgi:hypothetical protein